MLTKILVSEELNKMFVSNCAICGKKIKKLRIKIFGETGAKADKDCFPHDAAYSYSKDLA